MRKAELSCRQPENYRCMRIVVKCKNSAREDLKPGKSSIHMQYDFSRWWILQSGRMLSSKQCRQFLRCNLESQ